MNVTARNDVIGSLISAPVTDETLAAAKAGDRDAAASIMADLESRFSVLARRAVALSAPKASDGLRASYVEDLVQEACAVMMECLPRFDETSVDGFRAYVYRTAEFELRQRGSNMLNGTDDDPDGRKLFVQMVRRFRDADVHQQLSEGDYVNMAESAVQDRGLVATLNGGAYKSRVRMSPEAAYAARLAYNGTVSIYTPTDGTTIEDTLMSAVTASYDTAAHGYRPSQWVIPTRSIEAHLTLPKDADERAQLLLALDRFRAGTVLAEDLDLMESQPCRNEEFGTAVDTLRALHTQRKESPSASQASKSADAALGRGSIALTAQRAILEKAADDAVKRALVRLVIGMLSPRQGYILAATFGFMGRFKDDAHVAREMAKAGIADIDASRVRKDREKARAAFTKRWVGLMARTGSERLALEMAAAAQGVDLTDALEEY